MISLFKRTGVLSPIELESRYEVYSEQYILSIGVEAKLCVELARTMIYPATMSYLSDLTAGITAASPTSTTCRSISSCRSTARCSSSGERSDLVRVDVRVPARQPRERSRCSSRSCS